MENINKANYSKNNSDLWKKVKVYILSLLGIIIFFIPIKINNQHETLIYHISYFLENKVSAIIDISLIFFIILSILKNIINIDKSNINKTLVCTKICGLILLIFILIGEEDIFFISDDFIFILRDLILDLIIVLPLASLFMPLLLDYGLPEIIEAFTHKIMKRVFRVSGKVFLNFFIYLFVNNVCGVFATYKLYKDGKLREREACITILNFSILSLSLTSDLCNKLDISMVKFFIMEILALTICNIIISRIYPLKKKKQSYYFKSGHKNVNCKKHKLDTAVKKYYENKNNKKLPSLSLSYLNDAIYILMDLIPNIVIIFFVADIIYHIPFIIDMIYNIIYIIINKINIPNSRLLSEILTLNLFSSILGIKSLTKDTYYIVKIIIGLFITIQCVNISFLIPFIKTSIIDLRIKEILLVLIERFLIILSICFMVYNLYVGYIT